MKRGDKKTASNRVLYLLFGALCRDGRQKKLKFDRCKVRSCKNAVPSIFTWSDPNDEVRQRSERVRISWDETIKPFKRKTTNTKNIIAHWPVMDVSVSDSCTAWIIRA